MLFLLLGGVCAVLGVLAANKRKIMVSQQMRAAEHEVERVQGLKEMKVGAAPGSSCSRRQRLGAACGAWSA